MQPEEIPEPTTYPVYSRQFMLKPHLVLEHCTTIKKNMEDFASAFNKRIEIECLYQKGLQDCSRLLEKYIDANSNKSISMIASAFKVSNEQRANQARELAESLRAEVYLPMTSKTKEFSALVKQVEKNSKKINKEYWNYYENYHSAFEDFQENEKHSKEAVINKHIYLHTSELTQEKRKKMVAKVMEEIKENWECEKLYRLSVSQFNEAIELYKRQTANNLDQIETQQRSLIKLQSDGIRKLIVCEVSMFKNIEYDLINVSKQMEKMYPENDIQEFTNQMMKIEGNQKNKDLTQKSIESDQSMLTLSLRAAEQDYYEWLLRVKKDSIVKKIMESRMKQLKNASLNQASKEPVVKEQKLQCSEQNKLQQSDKVEVKVSTGPNDENSGETHAFHVNYGENCPDKQEQVKNDSQVKNDPTNGKIDPTDKEQTRTHQSKEDQEKTDPTDEDDSKTDLIKEGHSKTNSTGQVNSEIHLANDDHIKNDITNDNSHVKNETLELQNNTNKQDENTLKQGQKSELLNYWNQLEESILTIPVHPNGKTYVVEPEQLLADFLRLTQIINKTWGFKRAQGIQPTIEEKRLSGSFLTKKQRKKQALQWKMEIADILANNPLLKIFSYLFIEQYRTEHAVMVDWQNLTNTCELISMIIDESAKTGDVFVIKGLCALLFTFYSMENETTKRIFSQHPSIYKNEIWKKLDFWDAAIFESTFEEMVMLSRQTAETQADTLLRQKNAIFSQLASYCHSMLMLGVSSRDVRLTVGRYCRLYQMSDDQNRDLSKMIAGISKEIRQTQLLNKIKSH